MPCEVSRAERSTLILEEVECLNNVSNCQSEGSRSSTAVKLLCVCFCNLFFLFEYQSIANIAKSESKFKGIFDLTEL